MHTKPSLSFGHLHLLAVGNVTLDRYWLDNNSRLSPEAPKPAVLAENQRDAAKGLPMRRSILPAQTKS